MSTNQMIFSGSSEGYDDFMGRYSRQLVDPFLAFARIEGTRALDVGAGTGALTQAFLERGFDVAVAEPSADFVETLQARFPSIDVRQTSAESLPWPDATFDAVLSQLVVAFLPDAVAAVREQRRVVRDGGVVAACMWELGGIEVMEVLNAVRERLQPGEGSRLQRWRTEADLRSLFDEAGLVDVETATVQVSVTYDSVDDMWRPAISGAGPGGSASERMPPDAVEAGRRVAAEILGDPSGPFTLHARCACVRARRG